MSALDTVRQIVVFRPNAVGDFIFALPCLHALKARWPEAKLSYVGRQWHADFLTGRPGPIDEVLVLPPCPGVGLPADAAVDSGPLEDFLAAMRERRIDLALQLFGGGLYSNPLLRRFGARLCAGFKAPEAEPLDAWVHYGALQNRRLQMLEVAAMLGAAGWPPSPELQATGHDRRLAREAVAPADAPLVVIQPAASDPRRFWPAQRFARVADALALRGARIAVNGTAAEAPAVRAVLEHMRQPAIDLTGRLSLNALAGLLADARLLVSNDTGPLHLALALGTPSVGIYWLSNLLESGPIHQAHHRPLMSVRVHCPVCGMENLRERCEHDACFVDDVSLDAVMTEALALFDDARA